jgi:hypothetical protein
MKSLKPYSEAGFVLIEIHAGLSGFVSQTAPGR